MDSGELIDLFYNRAYEKFVNKQILDDKNYIVPRQQLTNYVYELVNIPFINFIDYIKNNCDEGRIEISDITQYRNFSACEIEMCNALIWANNPGCQYIDIGRFFPDYITTPNAAAYTRFGKNHIKAATQLGLTFEYYNYWYLSCLGYIYPVLEENVRKKLLARTITRNRLYKKILVDILDHDVKPDAYVHMQVGNIAKTKNSICTFIDICLEECKRENIKTFDLIRYSERVIDFSKVKTPLGLNIHLYNYINDIKKTYLSRTYTIDLIKRYRNGEHEALDKLFRGYMKLILSIANLYRNKGVDYDDLIQEGTIGLIKAIEHYNEYYNMDFSKYAHWWVMQSITQSLTNIPYIVKLPINVIRYHTKMWDYIQKYEQHNEFQPAINEINIRDIDDQEMSYYVYNLPAELKDMVSFIEDFDTLENRTFPINTFEDDEYKEYLIQVLLSHIDARAAIIVKLFYGIGEALPESLENIGKRLMLSHERVRQILHKTIKDLRVLVNNLKKGNSNDVIAKERVCVTSLGDAYIGAQVLNHDSNLMGIVINIQKHGNVVLKYTIRTKDGNIQNYSPDGVLISDTKKQKRTTPEREEFLNWLSGLKKNLYTLDAHKSSERVSKESTDKDSNKRNRLFPQKNDNQHAIGQSVHHINTPLYKLVQEGIITKKESHHCYKKRLHTIGDVYNIIKKYELTPESTRFTQYTLNIWFTIIKQLKESELNTATKDNNKKKQRYISFDSIYTKYTQKILTLRQAHVNGCKVVAKPVLLLALIEGIDDGIILKNHFEIDEWLEQKYHKLMKVYTQKGISSNRITEIDKPFWHLQNDGFWHISYSKDTQPHPKNPSKRWLIDNDAYAYMDDELWIMIKDKDWRRKLHHFIVENKLNN